MVWKASLFLACIVLQLEAKPLTYGFEFQNEVFLKAIKKEIQAIDDIFPEMVSEEEEKQKETAPTGSLDGYQDDFSSWLHSGLQSKRETWNNQMFRMKVNIILIMAHNTHIHTFLKVLKNKKDCFPEEGRRKRSYQ